ncbi:MAG: PilZ domain-containing protein [Candidatus Aminicenantaceae bacterium]|jgi:c-di-GMP-binding flagellar brake protein YcgR
MEERRKFKRDTIAGRVEVGPAGRFSLTHDISTSGIRILTDRYLPQDKGLLLKIALPGTGQSISPTAKVRWYKLHELDTMYEAGLEFVDISADNLRILENYLD